MFALHFKLCLIIISFSLLAISLADIHCTDPQKGFYMSYNALGKRGNIQNLFTQISSKLSTYNNTYNDGKGGVFSIKNLKPYFFYNDHMQKQVPINAEYVNVSLGAIQFVERFDFEIVNGSYKKTGSAKADVFLGLTSYFIKKIVIIDQRLEWEPTEISPIQLTCLIEIDHSQPKLTDEEKSQISLILNDYVGERKLKQQIFSQLNILYKKLLKQYLNKQQLIENREIDYKYGNISLKFINSIKNYTLSNNKTKGLQVFLHWQIENQTFNCTPDTISFVQEDYGGLQQLYSLSSMRQAFRYVLTQGLFDVKLNKRWEISQFQFYIGDLANVVSYAAQYSADQPISVSCKWSGNKSSAQLISFAQHDIYVQARQTCSIDFQGRQILQLSFELALVVRIIAQDESLIFQIDRAAPYGITFKTIDPNFIITNQLYAHQIVSEIVAGMNKSRVFGSGWKTSKRRFPSIRITMDYVVVFDPSEI